ncbi:DUF3298 and DUF4163 domain-containing protein [Aquimarina algiphila]|uniref:DUF3298 and DUF4163 domain-containing protein n=1 Tax=Aquimarina algiphila TaxID=2047982 RepID=A0A554VG60_9FLAO|nr:DUF3298 and DUF4163 domain-containing protein [Aquimarina algiphila]TSE06359.1 DUF3298 and DUF4163 domain-containing protein [Aquimarina algiphila]
MINRKPNTRFTFIYFLLIFIVFYSCNNKESFTFEKENFTVDDLLDCKVVDCASLEINLLKVIDDSQISTTINKEIEHVACSILNIGEQTSQETLKEAAHQFNTSYQEISEEFPDETVPYEASINCELGFQCKGLLSVVMDSYVFTGGAHGYGSISYINIDTKSGKRIANKSLFKDYDAFVSYAEKVFRTQHKIPEEESINSTGFFFENDVFTLPENIGFTDKEVVLYYNQYEINSYAEGPVELKLNKEEVLSFFAIKVQ